MFGLANKTSKLIINFFFKNKKTVYNKYPISLHNCNSNSYLIKRFCEKLEPLDEVNNLAEKEEKLSEKLSSKNLNLSKLTINILKYLERNFELYQALCEDSIKLSYDLSESPEGNEFVKSELMRINRQISSFSKDNYLFEELKNLLIGIDSAIELHKEAVEIDDEEIKSSALSELKENRQKLEELQQEIVEYFIPDEFVRINLLRKT